MIGVGMGNEKSVDSVESQVDSGRRDLLVATCAAGGVAGLATAGAFVSTFQPSERAKAAGAPVEVDIGSLAVGEMKSVEWRGKPVWILKRTPQMIAALKSKKIDNELADPQSEHNKDELTPEYARNEFRSIKPEGGGAGGGGARGGGAPGARGRAGPRPA